VDLTVIIDDTVDVNAISTLDLTVSGAEDFTAKAIAAAGKFKNRRAGIRYKPGASGGVLNFSVTAFDASPAALGAGRVDGVALKAGAVVTASLTIYGAIQSDAGIDLSSPPDLLQTDLAACGNGSVDPGEQCDPGPGSPKACPTSVADCDDGNPCTTDSLDGSGCQAVCNHVNIPDNSACTVGASGGVCLAGTCCTGCVSNGVCKPGVSDAKVCGKLGADCFDCTANSASATCNAGVCSGCDQTSCSNEGRTCGTSSCGFNCGGCQDSCSNGSITHYACVSKSCQQNGGDNCALYAACKDGHTCKTDANGGCAGDGDCVSSAYCSTTCKPKVGLGSACSAEAAGDHECQAPYVCSWRPDTLGGYCTSTRCDKCSAGTVYGNCIGIIDYGLDPRAYCTAPDSCHQAWCSGDVSNPAGPQKAGCDYGYDPRGNPHPCGSTSCSGNVMTGSICSNGCQAGQTFYCGSNSPYNCNCLDSSRCEWRFSGSGGSCMP
jgi:hypothetical protein